MWWRAKRREDNRTAGQKGEKAMLGLFLTPEAPSTIAAMAIDPVVKNHALEVVEKGYTVISKVVPEEACQKAIAAFRRFERANDPIFSAHRDGNGHYPRIINLHSILPDLLPLFTKSNVWLQVQDVLFGAPTALYSSIFYETGSQQSLHRDTPVFSTRPEYLYFGNTIYLESAGEENGCLEVLEGAHKLPELDREAMALRRYSSLDKVPQQDSDLWIEYQDAVVAQGLAMGLQTKRLYVEAGDILIWHPQLPHGGTPIKDVSRTRFSWVLHTTPVGVPVYYQDAFFNPKNSLSEKAPWDYLERDGRSIADFSHSGVMFGGYQGKLYQGDQFQRG
jgi:ectoine hydroxylase-related dioxygenase (phytanoyl-CoA dioxygenase family)